MGGQKGDRKSYKATSAAKAAEALASKAGASGFGGFSGARPVAGFGFGAGHAAAATSPATQGEAAGEPQELAAALDGELAQCLRHLSKRDTTTKLKALQGLDELVAQKTPAELTIMLQPWTYHFKRLLLDPSKAVRIKAAAVMAAVAAAVGKAIAPQLKSLLGPWYVAGFDPYPDAAAAAKKSLSDVFPGKKQADALMFCRSEVLAHIATCMTATPQSLGDPVKDTPEELQERHERVTAASLSAAAALLSSFHQAAAAAAAVGQQQDADQAASGSSSTPATAAAAAAAALQEVQDRVADMMAVPGFFKQKLGSKSAVVQRAAYGFIQAVCSTSPQLLKACLAAAAPAVMGALQDQEPANHPAMWEMLLAFATSQKPDCWAAVNVQKAVVPRLLSFLRHGCYGSSATSLPAVLPFLAQLPQSVLGLQPLLLLDQVLESIWICSSSSSRAAVGSAGLQQGLSAARGDTVAAAAVAAAYQECLAWGLKNAARLAGAAAVGGEDAGVAQEQDAATQYCKQLLLHGHFSSLLQLALNGSSSTDAQLAADITRDLLLQQCSSSAGAAAEGGSTEQMPMQLQVLLEAVGGSAEAALSRCCGQQQQQAEAAAQAAAGQAGAAAPAAADSQAAASNVCLRLQQLLEALTDSSGKFSQPAAQRLAAACSAALLPIVQAGQQLPAPAANLLARLIREFPGAARSHPGASTTSAAAAAAPAATAGAGPVGVGSSGGAGSSSGSSIPALVKLGLSSCAAGSDLAVADAELLLSCLAGGSDAAASWGVLLQEVASAGHTAPAYCFLNCLLQQATSSNQLIASSTAAGAAGANGWSHPLLDAYISEVLQQLGQQQKGLPSTGTGAQQHGDTKGSSGGLSRQQAAAAALLSCCLGANKQQMVLLGSAATAACMEAMEGDLANTVQLQEQQQQGQQAQQTRGQQRTMQQQQQPDAAAAVWVAVLSMVLSSSAHVAYSVTGAHAEASLKARMRSSGGGESLWQQQPEAVQRLLLLVWQLAWAADTIDGASLVEGLEYDGDSGSESSSIAGTRSGDSASSQDTSSSSSIDEDAEAEGGLLDPAAASQDAGSVQTGSSIGSIDAAWQQLHAAAGRLWTPELLATALSELPAATAGQLVEQLQQLLLDALQAAAAAAAAGQESCMGAAVAAAVASGTRLALRAAAVLDGLESQSAVQQQLLSHLLSAIGTWQQWTKPAASSAASSSSFAGAGGSSAVYALMLQFSSVLQAQAADVLLPLHAGHLLPGSSGPAGPEGPSSSSSSAGDTGEAEASRLWLRVELICASCALQQSAAPSESASVVSQLLSALNSPEGSGIAGPFLRCVTAAAAAAERQLVKAAGKGVSGAASATARSQLSAALAQLLSLACAAAAGASDDSSSSSLHPLVYSQSLRLLSRTVAAAAGSAAARSHLQPVLEQLVQQMATPLIQQCTKAAIKPPSQAAVLAPVLSLCAQSLRFAANTDASVVASGLSELSVYLLNAAAAVATAAAAPGSSASDEQNLRALLQLAVACFPSEGVSGHLQQSKQHQGTDMQHAGISTAAERQALAAVLTRVCSSSSSNGSTAAAGGSAADDAAAAVQLQCQLQLCCVNYCWAEMRAPEWHIVLRDAQQRLTSARRVVEKAAGTLAGAVCSAAQQLLGAASSSDAVSPTMAMPLLRRLEQKGLLQRQPAVADSLAAAAAGVTQQLSQLTVLPLALQVLVSVLQLQDQVQAAGRAPQLDLALAAVWRELLTLLLSLGAAVAVTSCCGPACSGVLLQHCRERHGVWLLLQQCLHGCSGGGGDAVGKVLAAADDKAEVLGVDSVGACLALLQLGGLHHYHNHHQHHQRQQQYSRQQQPAAAVHQSCEPLQQLAWELLLHPSSLASITLAASAASAAAEAEGGLPEYGVSDDAAAYLVQVGLRPDMAGVLASSKPWQEHLLLWALLLAHIASQPARSAGHKRLCNALREVPELVPEVLDRVATVMGLGGSSKGSQAALHAAALEAAEAGTAAAAGPLSAAAQASLSASLQAAGTAGRGSEAVSALSGGPGAASSIWNVAVALRSIGLPHSHSSWRLLAAAVYRAVLCLLPASARLWFSDLRDRSRSTAVESYTTRYESPAILAAEFAAIKRDAPGSSGEVGGSCSFRVVANPANREVAAVLEIEDGATLELVVKLPAATPLKAPEVDCSNKVGVKDGRLRKWLLSVAVFLRNQNQGVLEGISMWKANLEQEFAGVEPCLICYSAISAANGQLPRITCKQCSVKFHPSCLYKWFRTSGKSACPHCSALF